MKAYLIGAVLTIGIAAILSLLTPEGRARRTYHLLLSLCVLLVLTAPLAVRQGCDAGALPGGETTETPAVPEGGQLLLDATAATLRRELAARFDLSEEEIGVSVAGQVGEGGTVTLRRVTVVLHGDSRARRLAVKEYLTENIQACEVTVYVE